jgi:O-antigen/teichoic acid export membrane protein
VAGQTSDGSASARNISRDIVIYSSGDVATRALGFISVPIYTHLFLPAEYSLLAFVSTLATLTAGIAIIGGDTVLTRFWFEDEAESARRRLVTTWIGFLALSATVLAVAVSLAVPAFAGPLLDDSSRAELLWLVLATVPIANTSRMLNQILRNEFRPVPYAVTSFTVGGIALACGLFFVLGLDLGVGGILAGILVAESIVLVVRAYLTRSMLVGAFDTALLRRLLRFGLPLVPVTMSFWVFTASDRVILAKLGSFEELGFYSVALALVSIFALLSAAVGQAWVPRLFRLYERDKDQAARVVGLSIRYYVFALGLVALGISALAPELIRLLTAPEYSPAAEVVPLLALGAVAYGSTMLTSSGLTLTYRTGRLSWFSAAAAVCNVALALALVPAFGMKGAAVASLLGYTALTLSYFLASQRVWRVTVEMRHLLATIGALVAAVVATSQLSDESLLWRLLILPAFVLVTAVVGGVSARDRRILRQVVSIGRDSSRPAGGGE